MRAVNLLPKEDVRRRKRSQNVPALVAGITVAVLSMLLGAVFLLYSGKAKERNAELEAVKAELALLPQPGSHRTPAQEQLAAQQEARVAALSSALQHRIAWDRVLREFALVLPTDVWLTDLVAKSPIPPTATAPAVPAPGAAPDQFLIKGYTYSHEAVGRLLSRIAVMPDLRNVFLSRSTRAGRIVQFTISAEVRTPGATS
jgi:Tfp pilus assembly protein PilN